MDASIIKDLIPFLIPVIIIELALMAFALVDLFRRESTRGPKWIWILVIVLINLIGPIIYFVIGRKDE